MSDLPILVCSMEFLKNWTNMSDSVKFDVVLQWEGGDVSRMGNIDFQGIAETFTSLAKIDNSNDIVKITITKRDNNASANTVPSSADVDAIPTGGRADPSWERHLNFRSP